MPQASYSPEQDRPLRGFAAALVVAPRATRLAASILTILFGSDVLQIAYRKAEDTL